MANIYETGNTITLKASFKDSLGNAKDPDTFPTVTIYDNKFAMVGTPITLTEDSKKGIGEYEFNYTIPVGNVQQLYFYEFKGIVGGTVGLNRGQFLARFFVE